MAWVGTNLPLLFTVCDIMKRKGVNFRKFLLCIKVSEFVYLKIDIAMLSKAVSKTQNLTAIQSTP
jgi:hypothetical protein